MVRAYHADVTSNGRQGLLVLRAIRSAQHCVFSPTEVGTAWDDLVRWVRSGQRPAGDEVALLKRLARLMDDDALRANLSAAGHERATSFSWERAASETLAVYRAALG
jgi:glycosyltransferase involved in cell wall biosynthesis